jgi:hypothetical protein
MVDLSLINKSELARQVGLGLVYTHYLLAGERRSQRALQRIADHLGISLAELKAQIPHKKRQTNAPPAHKPRANKSRPDRRPSARNVSKSTR